MYVILYKYREFYYTYLIKYSLLRFNIFGYIIYKIRMFEYDSKIAIDSAVIDGNCLIIKFPNSEIQLGHSEGVEEEKIDIKTAKNW